MEVICRFLNSNQNAFVLLFWSLLLVNTCVAHLSINVSNYMFSCSPSRCFPKQQWEDLWYKAECTNTLPAQLLVTPGSLPKSHHPSLLPPSLWPSSTLFTRDFDSWPLTSDRLAHLVRCIWALWAIWIVLFSGKTYRYVTVHTQTQWLERC